MLYIFETDDDLWPLDLLRHQGALYVGAKTLQERIEQAVGEKSTIIPSERPAALVEPPASLIEGLFVPATVLLQEPIAAEGPEEVGMCGERIAYVRLGPARAANFDRADLPSSALGLPIREIKAVFIARPWDIIRYTPLVLAEDCASSPSRSFPNVVLEGDVLIEAGATIEPFTYIVGPTYIGRDVVIKAHSAIRQCVICEGSRVGGEITSSVIFPFSNKQHDGFLGHSVVGSWVNIGAGATGSNMKNTYGEIRADGESTGLNYFGQIIGDHTKIGIQAVMNTGSMYGICCSIFSGEGILPKKINDFVFGDKVAEIEAVIKLARTVMGRRGRALSASEEKLIRAYAG